MIASRWQCRSRTPSPDNAATEPEHRRDDFKRQHDGWINHSRDSIRPRILAVSIREARGQSQGLQRGTSPSGAAPSSLSGCPNRSHNVTTLRSGPKTSSRRLGAAFGRPHRLFFLNIRATEPCSNHRADVCDTRSIPAQLHRLTSGAAIDRDFAQFLDTISIVEQQPSKNTCA